jgi:hypothetical protein
MRQGTLTVLLFILEVALVSVFWHQEHSLQEMMPLAALGELALIGAFSKEFLSLKMRADNSVIGARKRYAIAAVGFFGLIAIGLGAVPGIWNLVIGLASAVLTLAGKLLTIRFVRQQGVAKSALN